MEPTQWDRLARRLTLPPQGSRLTCLPRCTSLGPACCYPAMRVRTSPSGFSRSRIYMLPIEGNAGLIGRTTTPPPKTMPQRDRAPGGLQEA